MLVRGYRSFVVLIAFAIVGILLRTNIPLRAQQPPRTTEKATLIRIIDGNTISVHLASNDRIRTVRLLGVQTSARTQPCYAEARDALSEMLPIDSVIRLETDATDEDAYRRLLRYVYIDDVFINAEMIEGGWAAAVSYEPALLYADMLEELAHEAQSEERACWQYSVFEQAVFEQAVSTETWYVVSDSKVNVRTCGSTACEIVAELGTGTELRVVGTENEWHEIILEGGQTAYIAAWLTSQIRRPDSQMTAVPTLRSRPSVRATPTAIPAGLLCPSMNYSCRQFATCEQAYACLEAGNRDLDRDNDGVPCESLCPGG